MAGWSKVAALTRSLVEGFGYQEIEVPVIEPAELVERGVGEATDVVQKEVYRFQDRSSRWLVLRPEATASVVRAYFQGNLNQGPQPARLWLMGPMFRYDRPQAGRYRQFHQLDVEAIGDGSPALDAELIEVAWRWALALGVGELSLQLNSIGDAKCRPAYRDALVAYYEPLADQLCPTCRQRLRTNPLRLFDCKEERDQQLKAGAPKIVDHLCQECEDAFSKVRSLLQGAAIPYVLNPELVRGLDYYTRTTFELWPGGPQGAQSALGGGGRYDGLAAQLGYQDTPGVGFAAGLERVLGLLEATQKPPPPADLLVLPEGGGLATAAAEVARIARQKVRATVDYSDRSLKAKMRSANHLGVAWVALFNAEEAKRRVVQLRDMTAGEQAEVGWDSLADRLSRPA